MTMPTDRLFVALAITAAATTVAGWRSVAFAQDTIPAYDLRPASIAPPGGLLGAAVPQFILVTFDDGINTFAESFIQPVVADLRNPDGTKAPITYFVTMVNTDSALAHQRFLEGNEIANHTASHLTNSATPYSQWIWELTSANRFFVNSVGVPSDQISGFRAPDLSTNSDLWRALKDLHFTYDASLSEQPTTPRIVSTGLDSLVWPYTLQNGARTACLAESCPDTSLPGLWSIPLWEFFDPSGNDLGAMDPAVAYDSVFAASLEYMFNMRYQGNRCPLGVYLHAGQMWSPTRQAILRNFLKDKLQRPDVWMVTMRDVIDWERSPVPSTDLSAWLIARRVHGVRNFASARPGTLTGLSPDDGASLSPGPVRFLWDVDLTASDYEVRISRDSLFSTVVLDSIGLTKTALTCRLPLQPGWYYWTARGHNARGFGEWMQTRAFMTMEVSSVQDRPNVPRSTILDQNYPNPFNPTTGIRVQLSGDREIRLVVYDLLGREVAVLANGRYVAGEHLFRFDGTNLASGMYFCRLTAGSTTAVRTMLLLR